MRTATATITSAESADGSMAPVPGALEPGGRLGQYEMLLPLASGGMGHVWAAARLGEFGFRRKVAIKVMREELAKSGEFRRRFLDEARLVSNILHTNVVEIFDLGVEGDILYQAMALVDGASLGDLLATNYTRNGGQLPLGVAVRIVIDALRGLHAAHELRGANGNAVSLVHRDVSPQNILVGLDGVAKITDFGIARVFERAGNEPLQPAEGKLGYMAPEQLTGSSTDRRADIFAVGVVLWELLAGDRASSPASTLLGGGTLPSPISQTDGARAPFGAIAMRALALDPDARFASAEEMAGAMERAAHQSALSISAKAVADFAATLISDRIQKRNGEADAQLARSRVDHTVRVDPGAHTPFPRLDAVGSSPSIAATAAPTTTPNRGPLWAAMTIGIIALALGGVFVGRSRLRSSPVIAEAPASSASEPAPPAVVATHAASPVPSPTPSASAAAKPVVSASSGLPRRPYRAGTPSRRPTAPPASAGPITTTTTTATPKYDNPYGK